MDGAVGTESGNVSAHLGSLLQQEWVCVMSIRPSLSLRPGSGPMQHFLPEKRSCGKRMPLSFECSRAIQVWSILLLSSVPEASLPLLGQTHFSPQGLLSCSRVYPCCPSKAFTMIQVWPVAPAPGTSHGLRSTRLLLRPGSSSLPEDLLPLTSSHEKLLPVLSKTHLGGTSLLPCLIFGSSK